MHSLCTDGGEPVDNLWIVGIKGGVDDEAGGGNWGCGDVDVASQIQ